MALAVRGLGHPWVHLGVVCSHCQVSPIEGYRYKCETCSDHNLCENCFRRGQPHVGHRFLQIARDSSQYHPPYQVFYITCHECGQAPIEGRCHRHRWRPNLYLCNGCYSRRPPSANPAVEWEVLDEPKISTICRTHSPVYHFHRQCGSCGVSPITGPRFDSVTYPEYSLCLICFDAKFVKGSVKNEEFLRIERPERHKVRHVFMYACRNCGEAPIDGPAYVNKRLPDKVLCLLCYMNIPEPVQLEYSRVDAPAQYGDPPPLALGQLAGGTVSVEEYSRMAQEFERFREEKEAAARVVAGKLLDQAHEIENLRKDLEEAQRVSGEYSSLARELEISKVEKDQLARVHADYASLVEAFERLKIEKEEALKTSSEYSSLVQEIERLKVNEEEATKLNAEYSSVIQELARLKEEKKAEATMLAEFSSLAQEVEKLKEEKEEVSNIAATELLSHMEELERLKEAARASAESCIILTQENEKLKTEREEALELASLAKELERLEDADKEETNNQAEYLTLVQEVKKLRDENEALVQELEKIREQHGEAYVNLTKEFEKYKEEREQDAGLAAKDYSTLSEELQKLKEEKEQAAAGSASDYSTLAQELERLKEELGLKVEALTNLSGDLMAHKHLKQELEQDYASLLQKCEKLTEDKSWLVQEVENVYKEKEEAARVSEENDAILIHEVARMKEEKDEAVRARVQETADLSQQCERLKLENESTAALHASLLRRYETLEKEKEEAMRVTEENLNVVKDVEKLREEKNEREEAARALGANYASLAEEFEKFKIEQAKAFDEKYSKLEEECEKVNVEKGEISTLYSSLVLKLEKLEEEKEKKDQEACVSARNYSDLVEELERLKKDKEGAVRGRGEEIANLKQEIEKLKAEKEAAEALSASLTSELEKLDAEATAEYSSLAQSFERYKQEKGELVVVNTPEYKRLLREYEIMKKEKAAEFTQLYDELEKLEEEHEEFKSVSEAQYSQLTQEYDKLKREKEEALRASEEDYARLSDEHKKLKSTFAFDLPGIGKCAQAAICTYGAMVLKKKISLEEGYAKSSLSRSDSKTLHEAERFIAEAAKELDSEYEGFTYEAKSITDQEALEYYLTTALPAHQKKISSKSDISQLSLELGAAKKRFSK